MKKVILVLLAITMTASYSLTAQVAVNNDGTNPDGSAMLDVKSNNRGFLPPRMTQSERNQITNPIPGLIIYCTDCIEMQFYNGTEWVNIDGSPATPPPNQAPVASNVSFSGDLEVGQILTGSYTYSDNESDTEGTSIYQWFRADDASGTNQSMIGSATNLTYVLQPADDSKYLAFEVTPIALTGASPGAAVMSSYQGAITTNQAPVASSVSFSGTLEVGQMLTGSYTYSDNESDTEGTSTYQWYRADDASGTNEVIISGSTSLTYILQAADDSKQIAFEVVPLAQTGTSPGVAVMSSYQGPIITANQAPVASSVSFSGMLEVGQTLTASYTYSDNESDLEGTSTFQWYRADDGSGTNQTSIGGATNLNYILQAADDSKQIAFEVVPLAQTGTSPGVAVMSSYQGPIITSNQVPIASNVSFNGVLQVGQMLTGSYTYSDNESDPQGTPAYQWYRGDDGSGTNQTSIGGATNLTYILQAADDSKQIAFEVEPVAQTGASPGAAVMSSYQGGVTTNQAPYQPSSPTPAHASTDQSVNATLSWSCSDPDSDPLTYDVYFGETNPPSLVSTGQSATTYDPGTLSNSTLYYWKIIAYDDHSHSTESSIWNFTTITPPWGCGDPIVDSRDSKSYNTIQIGTQCWMSENLDIGIRINGSVNQTQNTPVEIIEKHCYNDEPDTCDTYGGLYQWDEMMQYVSTEGAQGICPTGWYLPTNAEYTTLETYLVDNVGDKMKEAGMTHWQSPNSGTNSSGFTALPGGYGTSGSFGQITSFGYLWTSTESASNAWPRYLVYNYPGLVYTLHPKSFAFSVRCLKN